MTAAASTGWAVSLMPVFAMPSTVSLNFRLKLCGDTVGGMAQKLQSGGKLSRSTWHAGTVCPRRPSGTTRRPGILPDADRTAHGYRTYTPLHARALGAFLALVSGHGHQPAASIMRAVNRGAVDEAYRLIDESHAQLLDDRRTLRAVEGALRDLAPTTAPSRRRRRPVSAAYSSGRSRRSSASGPRPCASGSRPAWSARAATRSPGTASTTRRTCGTPGWPTNSGEVATCWSRSPP